MDEFEVEEKKELETTMEASEGWGSFESLMEREERFSGCSFILGQGLLLQLPGSTHRPSTPIETVMF
jgi:hypothetical protein